MKNVNIGDKVLIKRVTNASLNLYTKAKQFGLRYVKCPCNAKTGQYFEVKSVFFNGFLLKGINNSLFTVAYLNDLRELPEDIQNGK